MKEMVRIAGKLLIDDLRAELNTDLPSTKDKPHWGFSLDGISAQRTTVEPLAIRRRQSNGLFKMSAVGCTFKTYDKARKQTLTTTEGLACGLFEQLTKHLKLSLKSTVLMYNMSNTLDGKYVKGGMGKALVEKLGFSAGYWNNWCKMHIANLSLKEVSRNNGRLDLRCKLINKCAEKSIHKTGEQIAKELGPYFLSLTRFIDMRMVDHARKTFKAFFNN